MAKETVGQKYCPVCLLGKVDQTSLKELRKIIILNTLTDCGGNRTHAAKRLGIPLRTLRHWLDQFRKQGVKVLDPEESKRFLGVVRCKKKKRKKS